MGLESTFICIDNSDYMRNGDFIPNRLQSQFEAVNMVGIAKLKSNPENNIGLLSLADNRVLVTLTQDMGKLLTKLHSVQPNGSADLLKGIKVANLALKHRQGRNHKPRIVIFIGSPIQVEKSELIKLAKRLKKEKVNVDIVNFGEEEANREILDEFVSTLNGKDGSSSHLVSISPPSSLADALLSSSVVQGEDGSGLPAGFGPGYQYSMEDDPELAMALRISMEEQRVKQETDAKTTVGEGSAEKMEIATSGGGSSEDALMQQALAMSLGQSAATAGSGMPNLATLTEEEQLNLAIQMSIQAQEAGGQATSGTASMDTDMKDEEDLAQAMNDPEFLQRVISELPGVDPNSDVVRSAMDSLNKDKNKDKESK